MKIKGIGHFVLVTEDLQKCVEFYEGILGLEHVCEGGKHSLCFGSSKINIHTRAGEFASFAARPIAGSADFCLICEEQSAQQLKMGLESKGAQIELSSCLAQARAALCKASICAIPTAISSKSAYMKAARISA